MGKIDTAIYIAVLSVSLCSCSYPEPVQYEAGQSSPENTEAIMTDRFAELDKTEIIGLDPGTLSEEESDVLYQQARYCQAMCDADIQTLREIVSEDMIFTHMSGRTQTREEFFADIEDGSLTYYTIGIEDPLIEVNGDYAEITYTSVLNADAYGARGTFRMQGTHAFAKKEGIWTAVNRKG